MFSAAGDELAVKPSGFVLAGVLFMLTRVVVVGTLLGGGVSTTMALLRFVPLLVGLGLVVYGVSLAVSTHDRDYVNAVARNAVYGVAGAFALLGIAVLDPAAPAGTLADLATSVVLATGLIGGALAGVLYGRRGAVIAEQRRTLSRRGDQAVLLNRLLRHEILNSLTAIRGHAELLVEDGDHERSLLAVRNNAERVARTVDDIGFLVRSAREEASLGPVDLDRPVREAVAQIRAANPDASVAVEADPDATVRADEHLSTVLAELLHYAVNGRIARTGRRAVRAVAEDGGSEATVSVTRRQACVRVRVAGAGLRLGDAERDALLTGLPEYDAPEVGYGVSVVRLLVDGYGGALDYDPDGPAVVVDLPRVGADHERLSDQHGVSPDTLWWTAGASVVAGVLMGGVIQLASGGLPVIGALYGVSTMAVGWVTHLFHSVVFGLLFAAALSYHRLADLADAPLRCALAGALYGVVLWLVAAGVVMGVWLNLVGIPAPLPNLSPVGLAGHVLWGGVLGALFGFRDAWG